MASSTMALTTKWPTRSTMPFSLMSLRWSFGESYAPVLDVFALAYLSIGGA
jgi:hypothetical protein